MGGLADVFNSLKEVVVSNFVGIIIGFALCSFLNKPKQGNTGQGGNNHGSTGGAGGMNRGGMSGQGGMNRGGMNGGMNNRGGQGGPFGR